MSHGRRGRELDELDSGFIEVVADTMQALATPSRLRILGRLSAGSCAVGELAEHAGMEPSAVSHQLRLLRHLGLVVGHRDGRRVVYELYDEHVAEMLGEAVSHVEHLRLGQTGRSAAVANEEVVA